MVEKKEGGRGDRKNGRREGVWRKREEGGEIEETGGGRGDRRNGRRDGGWVLSFASRISTMVAVSLNGRDRERM